MTAGDRHFNMCSFWLVEARPVTATHFQKNWISSQVPVSMVAGVCQSFRIFYAEQSRAYDEAPSNLPASLYTPRVDQSRIQSSPYAGQVKLTDAIPPMKHHRRRSCRISDKVVRQERPGRIRSWSDAFMRVKQSHLVVVPSTAEV